MSNKHTFGRTNKMNNTAALRVSVQFREQGTQSDDALEKFELPAVYRLT